MTICRLCGIEVESDDLYDFNGLTVCENCIPVYANPPKPCAGGHFRQETA
ncbi:MAG: hypothetical protein GX893_03660 [Firmicutes bacterium]|nr:hypothetical protein [Bacillota bacterium]